MEGAINSFDWQIILNWDDKYGEETFLVFSFVSGIEGFRGWPRENLLFENLKRVDESMQ